MKKTLFSLFILVIIIGLQAQDKFDPEVKISKEDIAEVVKEVKEDSVAAGTGFVKFVEEMEKVEGLFTFYKNNETGEIYLELLPEQMKVDYIFTITRQTGDAYIFDASAMLWNFVFYFQQINKKVQLIERNIAFRSEEPSLKRALDNSFSNSIIASTKICCKAREEDGAILIKADDIFLKDLVHVESTTGRYKMKYNFVNYDTQDGLERLATRSQIINHEDGNIYLGGQDGIISFMPGSINTVEPDILVYDFKIDDISVFDDSSSYKLNSGILVIYSNKKEVKNEK